MKCLNVIIYYNNPDEVREYINECLENSNNVDIFVVINSDSDNKSEYVLNDLITKYNNIYVYDYHENVGYLNSILKVIQNIDIEKYEYYILSNTDIMYETPRFYENLVAKTYESDIGCIAPSVYATKSHGFSNPHYMERTSKRKFQRLSVIFSFPFLGRIYLKLSGLKSKKNSLSCERDSCYVYSPHGCFMIFTKEFIKDICGYTYGVTLYSEEACIGELLLMNKKKCYFDNTLRVHHNESTVTGRIDYKKRFKYWKDSIDFILNEFY